MKKFKIEDVMVRSFTSVSPGQSLKTVAEIMHKTKIEDLPVTNDDDKLIGVITKSSLLWAVSQGMSYDTKVRDLMVDDATNVYECIDYENLVDIVRTTKIGSGIITDADEKPKGIITKSSFMRSMFKKESYLNAQLNVIYQTMYNGLITVDSKKRFLGINRAGEKILHKDNSSLKGALLSDFLPGLDIDRVLILGKSLVGIEYFHGDFNFLCNITPMEENGQIIGCVIVFQDITDLVQQMSELESVTKLYRTLKLIMDNAYDGIVVVDDKSYISLINDSAAQFFRKNEQEILNRPVEELIADSKVREVVKTGVPIKNKLQFIDGVPYVVSILPILRKNRVIGAVFKILFRHLDEVKELAEKLDQAGKQLAYYKDRVKEKKDDKIMLDHIVTADSAFKKIKEEAEIAARGASNILITGESGTGKELLAQAIHCASPFAKGPLVKVNCAAIPENLLESEFFGYAPGAFTGAEKNGKQGKLMVAQGGSLFLDEIGDMSLSLQSKLLRVLQERSFEPVGSNKTVKINIRVIAATNQNLEKLVEDGKFRTDLFYRLNVVGFHIPPLRHRSYDVNLLTHFFLEKYNKIFGVHIKKISTEACEILHRHNWPGNVRELENVIERAINFAKGDVLDNDILPPYLKEPNKTFIKSSPVDSLQNKTALLPKKLVSKRKQYEIEEILAAIQNTGGNKAKAAKLLGISRSWMYEKLARFAMEGSCPGQ
ncbi:Transcriptional regulator containing PAS, AAA-type ATPase, and DNA-binding Fis domains [Desulfocicer vacuolatum DSM 3385]|uniref:Transcriptional regulator containing PAS, AAA-type ATPase, and DNA-binding Fis domains n=1 Tax=Desulfocicer vacuolatum DSM 3385 TaxID=1121400 RepID=A0A1W2EJ35_9BACT|nr:sigma-54-dependent Fis family transcriptional regulator [Desulfocicer vacuolatum]SMD09729.1 Transcriptional regulator containing PAS, AAA-type ATPase, and DNA-binding Fis domains [Desulfocicer vacuolatum DSM 3385]